MFAHIAKRTANYVFLPRISNKDINHMLHHVNDVFACMVIMIVIVIVIVMVIVMFLMVVIVMVIVMVTMVVDILMFVVAMAVHLTLS